MTYKAIILTIAAILMSAPAVSAQNANVTGTWNATFETNGKSYPAKMILNTDGEKTTGTIASERGEAAITGAVSGQAVTFSFTMQGENGPIAIAMKGNVDDDAMKGTFDHGNGSTGTWSASRGAAQTKEAPNRDA